jgi:hypothetical protein
MPGEECDTEIRRHGEESRVRFARARGAGTRMVRMEDLLQLRGTWARVGLSVRIAGLRRTGGCCAFGTIFAHQGRERSVFGVESREIFLFFGLRGGALGELFGLARGGRRDEEGSGEPRIARMTRKRIHPGYPRYPWFISSGERRTDNRRRRQAPAQGTRRDTGREIIRE